jgi:hypothetical protein
MVQLFIVPQLPHQQAYTIGCFKLSVPLALPQLVGIGLASVEQCSLGKTGMNHDLDFHDKDPTHLIGRLYVNANQFVVLEVFQRKGILKMDALDWIRQIQNRMGPTTQNLCLGYATSDVHSANRTVSDTVRLPHSWLCVPVQSYLDRSC